MIVVASFRLLCSTFFGVYLLCHVSSNPSPIWTNDDVTLGNYNGTARGVMVIVAGNGHQDMTSNPGRGWGVYLWCNC